MIDYNNKMIYPGSSDYSVTPRTLTFNGATESQTVTVFIRDDMLVENQFESHSINLRTYDSAVILKTRTARVTIEDNDSKWLLQLTKCLHVNQNIIHNFFPTLVVTIGFRDTYSVREDSGSISFVVSILRNSLARNAVVTFSTLDITARGMFGISDAYPAWILTYTQYHISCIFSHTCSWDGLHFCV